jgi:hypothetical protein
MTNPYRVGIELAMASNHAQVLGALSGPNRITHRNRLA